MSFTSRFKENAATVGNGLLFAVALTTPVVLGVAFQAFSLVSAASFGAMFALLIAPRHGALARVVGISTGGLLVVLAAALEEGVVNMNTTFTCTGSIHVEGSPSTAPSGPATAPRP